MDPPHSSVHKIFQARILEWVAISSSRGSSQPRDRTQISFIAGRFFTAKPREAVLKQYWKHTKRVDLKVLRKKVCNYVWWWMLTKLTVVHFPECVCVCIISLCSISEMNKMLYVHYILKFFLMWTIFKVLLLNLLQYCFCCLCSIFWLWVTWNLSSLTRDWTCTSCIGRQSLNHWTTKEVSLVFLLMCWFLD